MDSTQSLGLAGLLTSLATIIAYIVKINHKRIRSKCCNQDCVTSVDVEDTTPPKENTVPLKEDLKITIPNV
jgi:hypothetical protein